MFSQNPPRLYFTAKPIENLVYCFYKTKPVASIFYEFTGTINHRFLTSQNAQSIQVVLQIMFVTGVATVASLLQHGKH